MPSLTSVLKPKRTVSALVSTALLSAAVAVPLLTSPAAHASVKQTPGLDPGHTLSGVIHKLGPGFQSTFASYRNAPITTVTAYGGTDSWNDITAMGSIGWWQQTPVHHTWSLPLIPSDGSSTLTAAAAGAYDSKWVTVAQKLVAGGDANATIRLGWEMTGDWFAWSGIKNPTAWAGGFRHAVTAMRSVAGEHFTFDWDPALLQVDPTQMWPGDSYVDIVSADTYDTSYAWDYNASDHVAVWNEIMNGKFGWNWLLNFDAQHGNKPIALPEWGEHYMCTGHGGGDDVYFMDQIHNFIKTHNVAYETYFDANDSDCSRFILNDTDFPKASAEYRKLWAGNGVTTPVGTPTSAAPTTKPAPPTTVAPTTVAPTTPVGASTGSTLEYSNTPDLWSPLALDKASVTHSIYPFYPTVGGVKQVVFSLDGTTINTEHAAPWQLTGKTPALDPTKLTSGSHTVLATVTMSNGITVKSSATFSVPSTVGTNPVVVTPTRTTPVPTTPAPTTPAPTPTRTTPAPVVTAGAALQVSYSPDLSWQLPLAGLSADHNIYPFYPSSSTVKKVVFALDGVTINTDYAAPWAYTGSTPALNPKKMNTGAHTITATVTTTSGATLKSSATFTVVR